MRDRGAQRCSGAGISRSSSFLLSDRFTIVPFSFITTYWGRAIILTSWYCRDRVSSCNIYMQSKKLHKVFKWVGLFSTYVSSTCFGPHRSIIRSDLYKLYVQIWYVVLLCVLLDTPKSANTACTNRSWRWTDEVRNMSS